MKRTLVSLSSCLLLLGFGAVPAAHAVLISVTGAGKIISPPAFIGDTHNPDPTTQQGFDEKQDYVHGAVIALDVGSIPPGVFIDSHMIFFNHIGEGDLATTATWTFSGEILGVMSDINGTREGDTSSFLGAPGTDGYPLAFGSRGMEPDDVYKILTPTTLEVTMHIAQPGDWIRVITRGNVYTASDGGASAVLLTFACFALTGVRRFLRR